MGWHGPRGACGCCDPGVICDNCAALTYFTVSGLTDPAGCVNGCTRYNGTYVFRTIGNYVTTSTECGWSAPYIGSSNCGLDDNPLMYIGLSSGNCGSSHAWGIAFRTDPGGILIRVTITFQYKTESTTSPFPVFATSLTVEWRGVFASCAAAVGQSLSYHATTQVDCQMGATGDLCGLAGATIGLG